VVTVVPDAMAHRVKGSARVRDKAVRRKLVKELKVGGLTLGVKGRANPQVVDREPVSNPARHHDLTAVIEQAVGTAGNQGVVAVVAERLAGIDQPRAL
jgi:hypothetical protein